MRPNFSNHERLSRLQKGFPPHRESPRGFDEVQKAQFILATKLTGLSLPLGMIALDPQGSAKLEQRWLEIVNRPAAECRFTVVVPLHNERSIIDRSLHCLIRSILPHSLPIQILFVSNCSTDGTTERIIRLLERFFDGELSSSNLAVSDTGVVRVWNGRLKAVVVRVIETTTPGKLNALTIAQQLANARNDSFTICLDGDTFIEPETIAQLVKTSFDSKLGSINSATVAVTGRGQFRFPNSHSQLLRRLAPQLENSPSRPLPEAPFILGCCWAFSNTWFKTIAARSTSVIEDTTIAAHAYVAGRKVAISKATAWTFAISTLADYGRAATRNAHGIIQTINLLRGHEQEVSKLFGDRVLALGRPMLARWRIILNSRGELRSILSWPFWFGSLLFHEYFWLKGIRRAKQEPNAQTWDVCESTKGKR